MSVCLAKHRGGNINMALGILNLDTTCKRRFTMQEEGQMGSSVDLDAPDKRNAS
jgi:hypothetical protein